MKFNKIKKFLASALALAMVLTSVPVTGMSAVKAAEAETGTLTSVENAVAKDNVVTVTFNDGLTGKITFLEDGIFRYNVDPSGEFSEYPAPRSSDGDKNKVVARIAQYPDDSDKHAKPAAAVKKNGTSWEIKAGDTTIIFDENAKMSVKAGDKTVMEETTSLQIGKTTVQTLREDGEYFGGGTQNGRFIHTGKAINIENESSWNDGGVSSPNPFYYSTAGYGVLRNTFQKGKYNFGADTDGIVTAAHNEEEFDAYYFVSDAENNAAVAQELLQEYFDVTGNPALLPQYAFYLGHLNAYNRDMWQNEPIANKAGWEIKGNGAYDEPGTKTWEQGGTGTVMSAGKHVESLNGHGAEILDDNIPEGVDFPREFSAQAVIDEYLGYDMPMGFFLPNDGYGCGYGVNGFQMTDDASPDRLKAVEANLANLAEFAGYAKSKGVETGLWTQSNLTPDAAKKGEQWQLLRSFDGEIKAGVTTLKTDVAWVGPGYDFQLNGVKQAYDIMTTADLGKKAHTRPNIISLDGWAGSQRFNSVWTGDQTGGKWEYIRFHIPTFIGQSLSGNPNIGCDMDGIWGGHPVIATRDYQWKSFAPQMLDMDGWGSFAKGPYVHGDPYTGVSRMYLKLKAMMMSYTYTNAYAAANIDTGNGDKGLPMVRAMFLEYPEQKEAYGFHAQYQYMWGENLLVAPLYQNTKADALGNDIRDGIYLPAGETWIDYFTGEQYSGGQILNNFDAPLWKLPLFVKNGAIIPMFAEHNVATPGVEKGIDRTQRLVEFWPAGSTKFNTIEDDGAYIENNIEKDDKYGTIDNISYGDHVETLYTSVVKDGKATLTANKAKGTYPGYDKNKATTFIVNASKKPTALKATNGETALKEVKVDSKEAFDAAKAEAGTFVSFYDANPAIETFASAAEVKLADMVKDVKVSGKLYVKFAETDSQANAQTLVVEGFENEGNLPKDEEDAALKVPVLTADEEAATPTSITLTWEAVEGADSYEIKVDGSDVLYSTTGTSFIHEGLTFKSEHTYQIRSVGANGHSAWSTELTAMSKDDPFLNTPAPAKVTWTGGTYSGKPENAFNQIFEGGDQGFHSDNTALSSQLIVDYGNAYLFDKITYYHRSGGGNGTVRQMRVETSLDGIHWVAQPDYTFEKNDDPKVMDLSDTAAGLDYIGARFIRFSPLQSVGNFFHVSEMKVDTINEKIPGNAAKPFKVGNLVTMGMDDVTVAEFKNIYLKESSAHSSVKDPDFAGEIQKMYADINFNGYADVYDYAYTAFDVDGGTQQSGSIRGFAKLVPDKTTLAKDETVTIAVTAEGIKNLNAYGTIMHYDQSKLAFVSADYTDMVSGMFTAGMTGNIVYADEAYVNHNAVNMGNKALVNGSGVLSTITMKALTDVDLTEEGVIDLSEVTIIGPKKTNFVVCNAAEEDVETVLNFGQSDFNLTLTNDVLPTDDGSNVKTMIQTGSYDALFNGTFGRDWEFKWNPTPEQTYLKVPTTLHMGLKIPSFVDEVKVYNAETGRNGYLTSAKAQLVYTDGTTSDEVVFSEEQKVYDFKFTPEKPVASVDITFLSVSTAQMLTLAEIEAVGREIKTEEFDLARGDFEITMTNEKLPTDDGTNIDKLIEPNTEEGAVYDTLFDGQYDQRAFEFLWSPTEDNVLPTTMHLKLVNPAYVSNVSVYNDQGVKLNYSNGYLQQAKAQLIYTDGTTSEEIFIEDSRQVYEFAFACEKPVDTIDVTFVKATGAQMLTIDEIEVAAFDYVLPAPAVDKAELNAAIAAAKALVKDDYTAESWQAVETALAAAEAVAADEEAAQDAVNAAAAALNEAIDNLAEVPAACEHEWEETNRVEPTCTENGSVTFTCKKCQETKTEELQAAGHEAQWAFDDAEHWHVCAKCGEVLDEKAAHTWDNGTEKDNVKTFTCTVCGKTKTEEVEEPEKPVDPEKPVKLPFVDVKEGTWEYEPIAWAYKNKITTGINATHFVPDGTATRAQMITLIWRLNGEKKATHTKNTFKDVQAGQYYTDAVLWAVENGITTGFDKTHFAPDEVVTRGQAATFLYRLNVKTKAKAAQKTDFKDLKAGEYYYDAVLWAQSEGIVDGYNATTFGPEDTATRAQVVKMLYGAESLK